MEVLKLENLSKYYTSESSVVVGLSNINLTFSTGEFVALTGESGSGKSTLAHVLGGILPYEAGEMTVYGKPTSHYDAHDRAAYRRDMISFISQSYGILPGNTVAENVESALLFGGLSREEAIARTAAILREVELSDMAHRRAGKLSSGQKQRLSIARALAKPSKILIADEPTGNLDRINSEKVIRLLKRASADRLVILITHEFDEAKDVATRRIILSDGAVVTDARLSPAEQTPFSATALIPEQATGRRLAPYVFALTVRARPIFATILCLLLAMTTFITFVFLGTFIVATDDAPTRIYDTDAFYNGDMTRLVVLRTDGEAMTQTDYDTVLALSHTESIERFGYANDYVYYYKPGADHRTYEEIAFAPDYHPLSNPDAYSVQTRVEFFEQNYHFIRTLPYTGADLLTAGRAPSGTYEVVSADPDYRVGDRVTVYIKNPNGWSISRTLTLSLTVVGETDYGEGLYVSDGLSELLYHSVVPRMDDYNHRPWQSSYLLAPYDPEVFRLHEDTPENFTLGEYDFILPSGESSVRIPMTTGTMIYKLEVGIMTVLFPGNEIREEDKLTLHCTAMHEADFKALLLVSPTVFDRMMSGISDQISLYLTDYAYTDRVIGELADAGYIAISPYQLGSTEVDPVLANERMVTLSVCAVTFALAFILQCILLRAMFASMHEYMRLMSSTGLTAGTSRRAHILLLLFATLIGETVGAGVILALNAAGIARVADIFKYLDGGTVIGLFALHFGTVALSLWGILAGLRRAVFAGGRRSEDMDFSEMEDADV